MVGKGKEKTNQVGASMDQDYRGRRSRTVRSVLVSHSAAVKNLTMHEVLNDKCYTCSLTPHRLFWQIYFCILQV